MILPCEGPIDLKRLINKPEISIPDKKGNYLISIPQAIFREGDHGPSRFICIGKSVYLSKRLGEFFAATFGFLAKHSAGQRSFREYHINPWDLEFRWYVNPDPLCGEVRLFDKFKEDFKKQIPLLNTQDRHSGCPLHSQVSPIEFEIPWERTGKKNQT